MHSKKQYNKRSHVISVFTLDISADLSNARVRFTVRSFEQWPVIEPIVLSRIF